MSADTLSDVLKTVRLTGAVFYDCAAASPWVVESPPRESILPKILPGAEHLIAYHVVTEGRCYANILGEPPVPLEAGEVIVFTRGDAHVVSSRPGMRLGAHTPEIGSGGVEAALPFAVRYGGDGPVSTRFVCGYLACDARPFNPLLDQLPPTIKAGGPDSGWLGQFIRLAALESAQKSAGSETVLARLSELMFIEVVRRYAGEASLEGGWLSGLRDRLVGRSLSLLHADPARDWTIDDLARATGTSRSVLAERFHALVGIPPMQYLARWRMQIAAGLISGGANVAEAAAEVGYGSEATFSRAFKKVVGASPSAWRSRRGQASAAGGRETPRRDR